MKTARHQASPKAGDVYLCQMSANTVWSHMAGDAP